VLIAHNLRSTHNVGSLLRTADGLGVETVYLTGYTPYPLTQSENRLPHIAAKMDKQITKTALGAEKSQPWQYEADIEKLIASLKANNFSIMALEQVAGASRLPACKPPNRLAIVVGREVEGIEADILQLCDQVVEIPMFGKKESFNVAQAAAMALYHCRFEEQ